MYSNGQISNIQDAKDYLRSNGIKIVKSDSKDYSWFVPDAESDLSEIEGEPVGQYMTDVDLIAYANEMQEEMVYRKGGGVNKKRYLFASYPRVANDTGNGIDRGYVVNDGEMYFETQEGLLKYLREIDPDISDMSDDFVLNDGYDGGVYYWTEWDRDYEIDEQGYYYTKNGEKVLLSKTGGRVAKMKAVKNKDTDYMVFNYTDNIYASNQVFKTKKEANDFIKSFRNRFKSQGYYRDNRWNKIPIEEIDLLIIPSNFSPYNGKTSNIFDLGGKIEDHNAQMLYSQVKEIQHHAEEIMKLINAETKVESWIIAKGERSSTDLSDITHYLEGRKDMFCCGGSLAKGGTTASAKKKYKVEVLYRDGANFKNVLEFIVDESKAKKLKIGEEVTSDFFGISENEWYDNYLAGDYDPEFDHNTVEIMSVEEVMSYGGGVTDRRKNLGLVKVIFENPEYNYETNVGGDITEEDARKYFIGRHFDMGVFPKENFQKVVDIEFYPRGNYAKGGSVDKSLKNLYKKAEYIFNNNINNGGDLDFSEKEYGYLMDELDMVDVGYYNKKDADSTYAEELRNEGFTMTEQEAIDTLSHRIRQIEEELGHPVKFEFGGAIVDYSKGLLSDPTFDVQSAEFQMAKGGLTKDKYIDIYFIESFFGGSWSELASYESLAEAEADLFYFSMKEDIPHRITKRTILRRDYEKGEYGDFDSLAEGGQLSMFDKGGKTGEYFFIDGYYKDDKTEFYDYLVKSTDDSIDGEDDDVFYYGLSERDIKDAIGKKDTIFDFVITDYRKAYAEGGQLSMFEDGGVLGEDTVGRVDDQAFADLSQYNKGGSIEDLYTKLIKEYHSGGYENFGASFKSFIETKKETALENRDFVRYNNLIDVLDMYENDFYAKGGGIESQDVQKWYNYAYLRLAREKGDNFVNDRSVEEIMWNFAHKNYDTKLSNTENYKRLLEKIANLSQEYPHTLFKGGGVNSPQNLAKTLYTKYNRDERVEFLQSAGYSLGVSKDLSLEEWDSLEKNVHSILEKKILRFRNKLVQINVGKNEPSIDFSIKLIDMLLDGELVVGKDEKAENQDGEKKVLSFRNKLVQINVGKNEPSIDFAIKLIDMLLDGELVVAYAKGGGVGKAVSENFSEEELIQIASDYAYVISGNEERATYQLLDKDYTHTLLPKYISAIKKFESKYNKPVRAKGKMYKDMYPNIGND